MLVAAVWVAGCAQPHAVAPNSTAPPPYIYPTKLPWAGDVTVVMNDTCTPAVCATSRNPAFDPRFQVPLNATVTGLALRLTIASNRFMPTPAHVFWQIKCTGGGRDCADTTIAQAEGTLPLEINVANLNTPSGVILVSTVALVQTTPADRRDVHLEGMVGLLIDARIPRAPDLWLTHAVHYNGTTGPCQIYPLDQNCNSPPYPEVHYGLLKGSVETVDLNATWDAQTPVSKNLTIEFICVQTGGIGDCPDGPRAVATGPSPLRLHRDLGWPSGSEIVLVVHEPSISPSPFSGGFVQTNQSFQVAGHFTERQTAEEQDTTA
jgi:hypothetical protein